MQNFLAGFAAAALLVESCKQLSSELSYSELHVLVFLS